MDRPLYARDCAAINHPGLDLYAAACANPEVLAYGAWYTCHSILALAAAGWITLKSGSLELALGVHMANNFILYYGHFP